MRARLCFVIGFLFAQCNQPFIPSKTEFENLTILSYLLRAGRPPELEPLRLAATTTSTISLIQPGLDAASGSRIDAYIGLPGAISTSGSQVTGYISGPIDVSSAGCVFSGLSSTTLYEIVVFAQNDAGYDTARVAQDTGNLSPILFPLGISASDGTSLTLAQPTLSTIGTPTPTVTTYLGVDGSISIANDVVRNSIVGPIDVSAGGYQFTGLNPLTTYRIIAIAQNSSGFDEREITWSTTGIAPVLNTLSILQITTGSISIDQPTYQSIGLPTPTLNAYIGVDGTITVSGATVTNQVQGPVDLSSANGYWFGGLNAGVTYRVIVVAQNATGYSVQQIVRTTASNAPVLQGLSTSVGPTNVNLQAATFITAGNPAPSVNAYLGEDGTISITGTTVTGFLQGPFDVSINNHNFASLSVGTTYRIIVVAENLAGYSVQQAVFPL